MTPQEMQELIAGDWVAVKTEKYHVRGRVVAQFGTQVNVKVLWISPKSSSAKYRDVIPVYDSTTLSAPQIVWP